MNTVKDLRQVLSEEVTRLQPPAGLEARVLHRALRSSEAVDSAPRAGRRSAIRTRESKSTEAPRLMALVAAVLAIAIVISLIFAARALHLIGSVPASPGLAGPGKLGSQPMLGINMVSPSIGWWGDDDGHLKRTTDGGVHWSEVTPTGPSPLNDYYLDQAQAWVVASPEGLSPGQVHFWSTGPIQLVTQVTLDGGRSWQRGAAIIAYYRNWETDGKYGPFRDISLFFIDRLHGWLLVPSQSSQVVYSSNDAGLHWTLAAEATADGSTTCRWGQITFATESTGWMAADCSSSASARASLLATHDGGRTWRAQSLPLPNVGVVGATDCPFTGFVRPWTAGTLAQCFGPPVFFDALHGVLPIWTRHGTGSTQKLLVTADGGRSWSVRSMPGEVQLEVDFLDANNGWTIAAPTAQLSNRTDPSGGPTSFAVSPSVPLPLYRTDDGGATWTAVSVGLSLQSSAFGQFWRLRFLNQSSGFAVYGGDALLKTTDGGHTWS